MMRRSVRTILTAALVLAGLSGARPARAGLFCPGDRVCEGILPFQALYYAGADVYGGQYTCAGPRCRVDLMGASDATGPVGAVEIVDCASGQCLESLGCGRGSHCLQSTLSMDSGERVVLGLRLGAPAGLSTPTRRGTLRPQGDPRPVPAPVPLARGRHVLRACLGGDGCDVVEVVSVCEPREGCHPVEAWVNGEEVEIPALEVFLANLAGGFPELVLPVLSLARLEENRAPHRDARRPAGSRAEPETALPHGFGLGTGTSWLKCAKECIEDCGASHNGGNCKTFQWWGNEMVCVQICGAGCSISHPFGVLACAAAVLF